MTQRSVRWWYILPALVLAMAGVASCGDDGGTDPDPEPQEARIRATARVDGDGRGGVTVRLFAQGGSTPLQTDETSSAGTVLFEDLDAGTFDVEVVPPAGTLLAQGEDDRKSVAAAAGQTAEVVFDLEQDPSSPIVEVAVVNNRFEPDNVTIAPGTTVRWRSGNIGSTTHTITPDGHSEWTSVSMSAPDETFSHTFTDTGDYPYFCQPHQSVGMVGNITVQ